MLFKRVNLLLLVLISYVIVPVTYVHSVMCTTYLESSIRASEPGDLAKYPVKHDCRNEAAKQLGAGKDFMEMVFTGEAIKSCRDCSKPFVSCE